MDLYSAFIFCCCSIHLELSTCWDSTVRKHSHFQTLLENQSIQTHLASCAASSTSVSSDLKALYKSVIIIIIIVPHTQGAQVWITQFYLQITLYLPLPHKCSLDGISPDWGCGHLIAAYYSFIYIERMKGWVGPVGWPTADDLPT